MFSTGPRRYVSSSKSFLFSLYNINGYAPVKVNIMPGHHSTAIYTWSGYGPTFGGGHDLHISGNAGNNSYPYTNCGWSYPLPPWVLSISLFLSILCRILQFHSHWCWSVLRDNNLVCLCKLVCWFSQLSRTLFGKARNESDHLEALTWNSSLLFRWI